MKCDKCGKTTDGVDHNGRGLRCHYCWALLPDKPAVKKTPPKRKTISASKPKRVN